jgi:hypothetical protein
MINCSRHGKIKVTDNARTEAPEMSVNCGPVLGEVEHTIGPDDYAMPVEMFLDKSFGVGMWVYDPYDGKFIVWDVGHTGAGRAYLVVDRELRRHSALVTANRIN